MGCLETEVAATCCTKFMVHTTLLVLNRTLYGWRLLLGANITEKSYRGVWIAYWVKIWLKQPRRSRGTCTIYPKYHFKLLTDPGTHVRLKFPTLNFWHLSIHSEAMAGTQHQYTASVYTGRTASQQLQYRVPTGTYTCRRMHTVTMYAAHCNIALAVQGAVHW